LLAVIAPDSEEERQAVRAALAPARVAEITPPAGPLDASAREILNGLENSGKLSRSQGPLTGGAGI
jgi:hypothetical protein